MIAVFAFVFALASAQQYTSVLPAFANLGFVACLSCVLLIRVSCMRAFPDKYHLYQM